jgi:RimJ/RimL family protein N-acetyltransferase
MDTQLTSTGREAHRKELAELLELDPAALPDAALLVDDLALDSLAMMSVLTWLETGGVTIGTDRDLPASVDEVLSLLEKAAFPGLSILVTSGPDPARQHVDWSGPVSLAGPARPAESTARAAGSALVPVLSTHLFRLTPIDRNDIGFLYALAVQPETCFRWRFRGAPPPFERFAAELWSQVLVQYVVRHAADDSPVGLVVAYAAAPGLRHAYVGAVFHPQHTGTGLAAQAVALFVRYLFHTFPLRKLYMEVPGFNWPQLRSGEDRLFRVEGVLHDHDYYAGRCWDSYLCAIYPDQPAEDVP